MWKSVQIVCVELRAKELHTLGIGDAMKLQLTLQAACLRACSACSGDYEDPELTASSDVSEKEDAEEPQADHTERCVPRDGFPAREK